MSHNSEFLVLNGTSILIVQETAMGESRYAQSLYFDLEDVKCRS